MRTRAVPALLPQAALENPVDSCEIVAANSRRCKPIVCNFMTDLNQERFRVTQRDRRPPRCCRRARCRARHAAAAEAMLDAYGRGVEVMMGTYSVLDLTPKGRDEANLDYTMQWVRHHDRYEPAPLAKPARAASSCCHEHA